MRTYLDCYPCFMNQALRAGRMATDDERILKTLMEAVADLLGKISLACSPPEIARQVYSRLREITGVDDPYQALKAQGTRQALALYPEIKRRVETAPDPLLAAVRAAAAGNVIDFGVHGDFDMEGEIRSVFDREFAVFDYPAFRRQLGKARRILYLGDNAGETVFDRILIETLDRPVTYAVRERPIINDATRADAEAAGLGKVARIVSSGTDAPGTVLSTCSWEFQQTFREADLIISKGQGNYEALSGQARSVAYLLKAKCAVVAGDLGCDLNGLVLLVT